MTFSTTDDATVERAARALWRRWNPNGPRWDRTTDQARDDARGDARAALAAARAGEVEAPIGADVLTALDDLDPGEHTVYVDAAGNADECVDDCQGCAADTIRAALAARGDATPTPCCTSPERIEGHWLVETHTHCTCGAGGPHGHEPGCGLVPLVDLRGLDGWDGLRAEFDATPTVTEWAARVTWKDGTTFEDEAESREWGEALVSSWGASDDRTAVLVQREVSRTEWREVQP